jgi:hypothetical protein
MWSREHFLPYRDSNYESSVVQKVASLYTNCATVTASKFQYYRKTTFNSFTGNTIYRDMYPSTTLKRFNGFHLIFPGSQMQSDPDCKLHLHSSTPTAESPQIHNTLQCNRRFLGQSRVASCERAFCVACRKLFLARVVHRSSQKGCW